MAEFDTMQPGLKAAKLGELRFSAQRTVERQILTNSISMSSSYLSNGEHVINIAKPYKRHRVHDPRWDTSQAEVAVAGTLFLQLSNHKQE